MKPHKRLIASLTAIREQNRPARTNLDFDLPNFVQQGSARFLPGSSVPANRAERRVILFAPPRPVASPPAPVLLSEWLRLQPGSTRRGVARGRFTTFPKNVLLP